MLPEVDEAQLPALYGGAEALLLPSRHEGFGLPALEAMATGTPVLAANAGSLPEVTGGAAELLDPDAPEAWIAASAALVENPALRARWASAGRERARAYTWERCARQTLARLPLRPCDQPHARDQGEAQRHAGVEGQVVGDAQRLVADPGERRPERHRVPFPGPAEQRPAAAPRAGAPTGRGPAARSPPRR